MLNAEVCLFALFFFRSYSSLSRVLFRAAFMLIGSNAREVKRGKTDAFWWVLFSLGLLCLLCIFIDVGCFWQLFGFATKLIYSTVFSVSSSRCSFVSFAPKVNGWSQTIATFFAVNAVAFVNLSFCKGF